MPPHIDTILGLVEFRLHKIFRGAANAAATQSIIYNAIHGIVLTIGCIAVMPLFLHLFTTDEQVIELGVRYSRIAFVFAVFVAVSMSLEKIFQAVGKC